MKHVHHIQKTSAHLLIVLWLFIGIVAIVFFPFIFSSYKNLQENRYVISPNETTILTAGVVLLSCLFIYLFYHCQKLYKTNVQISIRHVAEENMLRVQQRMLSLLKEDSPQEKKLRLLMEEAADLLKVRWAGIGLFDANLHLKSLVHLDNKTQELAKNFVYAQENYASLIKSLSLGATLPIDNIDADLRTETIHRDFPEKKEVHAILYAPLHLKNAIAGACWFETDRPHKWSLADNQLAAFVAEVVVHVLLLVQQKKEEHKLHAIQQQFATIKEKTEWGMAYFQLATPIDTKLPFSEQLKLLLQGTQLTEANTAFYKTFQLEAEKQLPITEFLVGKPDLFLLEFINQQYVLREKEFVLTDGKDMKRYVRGNLIGIVEQAHLTGCWLTVIDITEQKVSEQYYRQITESASNMMTLLNKEHRVIFDSDAVLKILGFDKTARLNQSIFNYIHHDDTELLNEFLQRAWQQLTPLDFAGLRFRTKDGAYVTGDGALVPVKRNDIFSGMLLEFRLNAERNLLEKTLLKEVNFFRGIAEAIDEVIALLDKEGNILYENQAMERIFGYKTNLRIGRYGFEYIHTDDVQEVSQLFRLALENPHVHYQKEIQFLHASGEWKVVVLHLQNELDREGIQGILLRIAEQTEQTLARKHQEKENEIFKSLVQYSPNTYLILDERANITFGSEEVLHSLGYYPQELEGRNFIKLVHPQNKNAVLDNLRLLQSSPESKVEFQVAVQHDSGEWRTMQIVGKWMAKDGMFLGILLEMNDISQITQRINSLQEQLSFYQALNDSSGCLIFLVEPNANVLYANPTAERQLALQAPFSLKEYFYEADWQELLQAFERLEDNPTQRIYLDVRMTNQQAYIAICTNASLRSSVKGILIELINKNLLPAAPSSSLSTELLASVLGAIPHTVLFQITTESVISMAQGAGKEIFGMDIEQLSGRQFYDLLEPSSRQTFKDAFRQIQYLLTSDNVSSHVFSISLSCAHPTKEKVFTDAFLIILPQQPYVWLYLQNASTRHALAQEIRQQRWLNDQTQELIAVVESTGTIRFANDSFHKVFCLYEGENIEGIVAAFEDIAQRKEMENILQQVGDASEKTFEIEPTIRLGNGKYVVLKIYVQNLLHLEPLHAILFRAVDVTELHITRKDLEKEIAELNAELRELTERIGESYQKEIQSLKEQLTFAKEHALTNELKKESLYHQELTELRLQYEERLASQKEEYEKELKAQEESFEKRCQFLEQKLREQETSFKINQRLEKNKLEILLENKEKQLRELQEKVSASSTSLVSLQQALADYEWHVSKAKMSEAALKACLSFIRHYQELAMYFLEKFVEIKVLLKMYEEIGQTNAFQNVFKLVNEYRRKIQWEQTYFELPDKEKALKDLIQDTKMAQEYTQQLFNYALNDRAIQIPLRREIQMITNFYPPQPRQINYLVEIADDFYGIMPKGHFIKIVVEILSLLVYTLREIGTIQISQWQEEFAVGLSFVATSPTKSYRRPEVLLEKEAFFMENRDVSPMQSIPLLALQETLRDFDIPLHVSYDVESGIVFKIDLTKIVREGEFVQRRDLL